MLERCWSSTVCVRRKYIISPPWPWCKYDNGHQVAIKALHSSRMVWWYIFLSDSRVKLPPFLIYAATEEKQVHVFMLLRLCGFSPCATSHVPKIWKLLIYIYVYISKCLSISELCSQILLFFFFFNIPGTNCPVANLKCKFFSPSLLSRATPVRAEAAAAEGEEQGMKTTRSPPSHPPTTPTLLCCTSWSTRQVTPSTPCLTMACSTPTPTPSCPPSWCPTCWVRTPTSSQGLCTQWVLFFLFVSSFLAVTFCERGREIEP